MRAERFKPDADHHYEGTGQYCLWRVHAGAGEALEVVFAHRIQRVWLKEKLRRGLPKNCVAWSSPLAVWTEIIALGIRKLYSASQVSSTIVGVDLPVGCLTMRAT